MSPLWITDEKTCGKSAIQSCDESLSIFGQSEMEKWLKNIECRLRKLLISTFRIYYVLIDGAYLIDWNK